MVVDPGEAGVLQGVGVPHVPRLPALEAPAGPEHVHPDTPLGGVPHFGVLSLYSVSQVIL